MNLKSHNLTNGSDTVQFVVWSKRGEGMVNVFRSGDDGGEMLSVDGARKRWNELKRVGYSDAGSSTVEVN